jgi:hypothetical protein
LKCRAGATGPPLIKGGGTTWWHQSGNRSARRSKKWHRREMAQARSAGYRMAPRCGTTSGTEGGPRAAGAGGTTERQARNPRRPAETAAKFLDWLAGQPRKPAVLSREAMRRDIWNFLDGPARWETSVQGPVRGGPRDHLIIPFAPGPRDVGRVAAALRRAF